MYIDVHFCSPFRCIRDRVFCLFMKIIVLCLHRSTDQLFLRQGYLYILLFCRIWQIIMSFWSRAPKHTKRNEKLCLRFFFLVSALRDSIRRLNSIRTAVGNDKTVAVLINSFHRNRIETRSTFVRTPWFCGNWSIQSISMSTFWWKIVSLTLTWFAEKWLAIVIHSFRSYSSEKKFKSQRSLWFCSNL